MEKKRAIIIAAVFAVFILGFSLWHLLLPDGDISVFERRRLEQVPEVNGQSILSGQFSQDLEDYLLDQFPLRQDFVSLNTALRYYVLGQTQQDGIYLEEDSVFEAEALEEGQVRLAANKLEKISQDHLQNSNVYYAVIPDKAAFMEAAGQPMMDYSRLDEILADTLSMAQKIDIRPLLAKDDYYRTDLHWKQENIYPVAEKLARSMGAELVPFEEYESHTLSPFYGSYYARSPKPLSPDSLTYLTSPWTQSAIVTGGEFKGRRPVYMPALIEGVDGYDVYLSGAQAFLTIEVPNAPVQRELVIFRDSFGSSIAPYFLGAYSKVTLVDLRYMSSTLLEQYVDFENADVLFLYSATLLNRGSILK